MQLQKLLVTRILVLPTISAIARSYHVRIAYVITCTIYDVMFRARNAIMHEFVRGSVTSLLRGSSVMPRNVGSTFVYA